MRAPSLREDPIPVVENAAVWTAAVFAMVATMATLGIVGVFVVSVISRWFGHPFDVTNIVSGLLVLATMSGMAWTTVRGEHVSVQVVTEKLGAKANWIIDIIIWTLATGYLIWLITAGFQFAAARTWPNPEMINDGVGQAPLWPWRWVFAAALIPFLFLVIVNLIRSLMRRRPYDDVIDLDELAGRETAFVDPDIDGDGVIDMGEALKAASLGVTEPGTADRDEQKGERD